MTFDPSSKLFYVKTTWKPRREDAASIAERLRRLLDEFGTIDETLRPWVLGVTSAVPYRLARDDLATIIRRDFIYGEDGELELDAGYDVVGWSEDKRQAYSIFGSAGGIYPYPMCNGVTFETRIGRAVDESVATYALMKKAALAMIACWEPITSFTRSNALVPDVANEGSFAKAWMTYVRPTDAASVDLVGVPFSERTPDGGLLLSATNQTFDTDDPTHIEGAQIISRATQHLNGILEGR